MIRRELDTPTNLGSLIVGLLTTFVSFAIVDELYFLVAREVLSDGHGGTLLRFSLPSQNGIFDTICLAAGVTAIGTRKWILPFMAGLLGYAMIFPMYGGSGPITNYESLLSLHLEMLAVALTLNMMFAILWIRASKRSSPVASEHGRKARTA